MTTCTSREIRLRSRPAGDPQAENFSLEVVDLEAPELGEVQVRNVWMSVDPYMRGRMRDRPSYVPPFKLGEPLTEGAVGEVVCSSADEFRAGDMVLSMMGWREVFNAPAIALQKIDATRLPSEAYLGVAGLPGLTAYIGALEIARIKVGDIVFVSAAAGAVGLVVCQIAKIKGATVIGSAGGAEKCAFLREIGCDHVIDYRATLDLATALAQAAPEGLDVYFDNVGGAHLDAALIAAKSFARFALCGMISQYNNASGGLHNIGLAVGKRLRLEGYIVSDHFDKMPTFTEQMATWIGEGRVKWRQTIDEGIEQAPAAFSKLFSGGNLGKMLVKLS